MEKEQGQIIYIPVDKLHPHPQNPRKDVGDVSELAESLKAHGVLQNLTVVPAKPGYCPSCTLYQPGSPRLCAENHSLGSRPPCKFWQNAECYTVIIGHRRLAAAKLAGLSSLPCTVTNMSEAQQVRTMLTENMQRSDLTVYEQAQGFQLMLNFGDTVDEIAERAGFSKSTVRSRVKLLELDKDKFKKASERGATLFDFAELNKIEDAERRNKLLDFLGTGNFKNKLAAALDDQERDRYLQFIVDAVSKVASSAENEKISLDTHVQIKRWTVWEPRKKDIELPEIGEGVDCWYIVSPGYSVELWRRKTAEDERKEMNPIAVAKQEFNDRIDRDKEQINQRHFSIRREFIKKTPVKKITMDALARLARGIMFSDNTGWTRSRDLENNLGYLFGVRVENADGSKNWETLHKAIAAVPPEQAALRILYAKIDSEGASFGKQQWDAESGCWSVVPCPNKELSALYEALELLGYEKSDEEIALENGTHEIYTRSFGTEVH